MEQRKEEASTPAAATSAEAPKKKFPTLEEDVRAIRGILGFFQVVTILGIIASIIVGVAAYVSNENARIRELEYQGTHPHYP